MRRFTNPRSSREDKKHESRSVCTKCVSSPDLKAPSIFDQRVWRLRHQALRRYVSNPRAGAPGGTVSAFFDARPQPIHPIARDRHRIRFARVKLDGSRFAGAFHADHMFEIDDMAAMDAGESTPIEARLDEADRQRTEQLRFAVENVGVVRGGV